MKRYASLAEAYDFFHDATLTLAEMEHRGFCVDTTYINETINDSNKMIAKIERSIKKMKIYKKWFKMFGEKTNIYSPQQLGKVMNAIGFVSLSKTKKGNQQWNETALEKIDHPFCKKYLRVKKLRTNISRFNGYIREILNGKLHCSYNLAGGPGGEDEDSGPISYRGSSTDPNLQNIPQRNKEIQRLVRPMFIAPKNFHFCELDLATIEVRGACAYTRDKKLREYMEGGGDMHHDAAKKVFLLDRDDQVERSTARDVAKNRFVFQQFYGGVYWQCAPIIWEDMERRNMKVAGTDMTMRQWLKKKGIKRLGVVPRTKEDLKNFVPEKKTFLRVVHDAEKWLWNENFTGYTQWKKDWYNEYKKKGYFKLFTGFICRGYYRRNQVLNFGIQGFAFHILLWIIMQINKELKKRKMKSYIFGQIHDSLLSYVHKDETQEFLNIAFTIIEKKVRKRFKQINVPIKAEVSLAELGDSWLDKVEWKRNRKGMWEADE